MYIDYTTKLFDENLSMNEFVDHCISVFKHQLTGRPTYIPTNKTKLDYESESIAILNERSDLLKDEIADLRRMSDIQKIEFGNDKRDADIRGYKQYLTDGLAMRAKLIDMQNQINCWKPNSSEMEHMKEFIVIQVRDAIVDNNEDISHYEYELRVCEARTPLDYYRDAIYQLKSKIDYFENMIENKNPVSDIVYD